MFRLLAEGKLKPYLHRRLAPGQLLLFLHIPKTAGSSLTADFARLLPPYMNLAPDYSDTSRPFPERQRDMLERFAARLHAGELRSAFGHHKLAAIRRSIGDRARVALVSMLRDPVTRVVSDYRYMTSPAHPDHAEALRRFPSLAAFAECPGQQNMMAQYLLDPPGMPDAEIPGFLDRTYHFLGTVEEYAMSSYLLFALAGLRHVSTARERVAPGGPTRLDELDPALVARIAEFNRRDALIYRHVSGVLARIKPAYEALVGGASPSAADSAAR